MTNTTTATTVPASEAARFATVTSRDGTTIAYRQLGQGPGIVMLHGAMETSASHLELAEALADRFTIALPDRRGRGRSGPSGPAYAMQREVEDLDALLAVTGAHNVFGVSAGGLIALEAARVLPTIHKLALFEPALVSNGNVSLAFIPRYEQEIAQGKVAAALVTGMLGTQMGPAAMRAMPRWLLAMLTGMMLHGEAKKAKPGDVTMGMLAPTLHNDLQLVKASDGALAGFTEIQAETLLLGGSKSPKYLKLALDALEPVLPHLRQRIEFPGLDHGASGPTVLGGKPAIVAQALREFFE